jgi:hypothetical protein
MIEILHRKIELVFVMPGIAAISDAATGQNP